MIFIQLESKVGRVTDAANRARSFVEVDPRRLVERKALSDQTTDKPSR